MEELVMQPWVTQTCSRLLTIKWKGKVQKYILITSAVNMLLETLRKEKTELKTRYWSSRKGLLSHMDITLTVWGRNCRRQKQRGRKWGGWKNGSTYKTVLRQVTNMLENNNFKKKKKVKQNQNKNCLYKKFLMEGYNW